MFHDHGTWAGAGVLKGCQHVVGDADTVFIASRTETLLCLVALSGDAPEVFLDDFVAGTERAANEYPVGVQEIGVAIFEQDLEAAFDFVDRKFCAAEVLPQACIVIDLKVVDAGGGRSIVATIDGNDPREAVLELRFAGRVARRTTGGATNRTRLQLGSSVGRENVPGEKWQRVFGKTAVCDGFVIATATAGLRNGDLETPTGTA